MRALSRIFVVVRREIKTPMSQTTKKDCGDFAVLSARWWKPKTVSPHAKKCYGMRWPKAREDDWSFSTVHRNHMTTENMLCGMWALSLPAPMNNFGVSSEVLKNELHTSIMTCPTLVVATCSGEVSPSEKTSGWGTSQTVRSNRRSHTSTILLLGYSRFLCIRVTRNLTALDTSSRSFGHSPRGTHHRVRPSLPDPFAQLRLGEHNILSASLLTPRTTACAPARVSHWDELRRAFVSPFTGPRTCWFGHFRTTIFKRPRLFVKNLTGLLRALRLLGSLTSRMLKCEILSNRSGAPQSLRIDGWFKHEAPTRFSTRNRFPTVSSSSYRATTQSKWPALPCVLYQPALSLGERRLRMGDQTAVSCPLDFFGTPKNRSHNQMQTWPKKHWCTAK